MNVWQRLMIGLAVCLLAIVPAVSALGATVSGRSSTEIEWFDTGRGETAVPAYEYLLLNVRDLGIQGLDFKGYGRLSGDLNDEIDADSRLYYAYLEKKGLVDGLDLKLGRQFLSTTAGASLMDGLHLNWRNLLGPVGVKVFGGGDVSFYEGYNAKDLIDGAEVYGRFFDSLDLGLSYLQRWDHSELANELFGFDAEYDFRKILTLSSETQFNYLSNSVSYFTFGADYHRSPDWSLRAEYLYSLPVFSSTSIYSVFAVDEYQEALAEMSVRLAPGLRTFARYTHEFYQDVDDADVIEAGIEQTRVAKLSGYLTATYRADEDGQDLYGFKARAVWLFNRYLQAGLGAHVDVLERRIEEDDETTSSRIWVDATAYLSKKVNVEAKLERTESDLWDDYYRGRVRLNILF